MATSSECSLQHFKSQKERNKFFERMIKPEAAGLMEDYDHLTEEEAIKEAANDILNDFIKSREATLDEAIALYEKTKVKPVVKPVTKRRPIRNPLVSDADDLLTVIAKLGSISTQAATEEGLDPKMISNLYGSGIRRVFTKKGIGFDEMAELLRGYDFDIPTANDLLSMVSSAINQNVKHFNARGAEIQAEIDAKNYADAEQDEFASRVYALLETVKRELPDQLESWKNSVESGAMTPDNIYEYEQDLDEEIQHDRQGNIGQNLQGRSGDIRQDAEKAPTEGRNRGSQAQGAEPDSAEIAKADEDLKDALGDLGDIFGKNFRMNITPEQEQKLIPVLARLMDAAFRKGYYSFKQAARFILDTIRSSLGEEVANQINLQHLQGAYIAMSGKYQEQGADSFSEVGKVQSLKEIEDVSSTDQRVARNSQDANPEIAGNGEAVKSAGTGNGSSAGGTSDSTESARTGTGRDRGDSVNPAAGGGKRGDQSVHTTEQSTLPSELPPGIDDRERGGNDSNAGIQAFGKGNQPAHELAKQRNTKVATAQTVILSDPDNIAATLPMLDSGQRGDVLFAEKRLAEHKGVMFTNGTGTGKTFTSLGIIKRSVLQGKENILIVVPSVGIGDQWIKAASDFFGINITPLKSTQDAGKNIVITTYANFGVNPALVNRDWDQVVMDEAHKILSNEAGDDTNALATLRGITQHHRGFFPWFNAKYTKVVEELRQSQADKKAANGDDVMEQIYLAAEARYIKAAKAYDEAKKKAETEFAELRKSGKSRVVFLSATPFAYVKSIDYAEGYLFDYGPEKDSSGYNSGNNQQSFMMTHFGYRMRYNKLARPEADVNTAIMERQFNTMLRQSGALSYRGLDVNFDYDRQFILTESAIGTRIDEAMEWIRKKEYRKLSDELNDKFDYLQRRYLLEALKAKESISIIRDHLALGRKVIVFHDYKKGGTTNPFIFSNKGDSELAGQIAEFNAQFGDIVDSFGSLPSPIDLFQRAFGQYAMIYNGSVSAKERIGLVKQFNEDNSGKNLILVQSASAKEGVSFHDTTGKHQRVLINLGLPTQPTTAIQQEGRIYRVGQASNAIFRYLNTGTNWERWAFARTIAERASTAENLAAGEAARALKDSFINAFEASDSYTPGHEGEGQGGKALDKAATSVLTEFDRAKTLYFGQQKKTSRTKSAEGVDYYATPEPVGYMMAQIADAREGDSMLEPSAGHGAIARWFREDAKRVAVEPSGELSSRLALSFGGEVKRERFEDLDIHNKYDTIVMNPPFGVGGKLAIEHIKKAIRHLRQNGRIVALIPEGGMADKRFDALMESDDAKGVYQAANISLPTVTFERAGTKVKTRIVVLDKVALEDAPQQQNRDYSSVENIKELFDRIENLSINPRKVKVPEPAALPLDWNTWKTDTAKADASAREAEKVAVESGVIVDSADKAIFELEGDKIISNAPAEKVTTKKGKELDGIFVPDDKMAKAVDEYTYQANGKGNGWFVRLRHVIRPSNTVLEPKSAYSQTDIFIETPKTKREASNAGYQQDLFGNPLPDERREANARSSQKRDVQPTAAIRDTGAPKGRYATRTKLLIERTRNLGSDVITNPSELAQAIHYLGASPVEYFDAIVTDAKGKPLAVVGSFKGEHAGASVYPAVVVAEAFRIEGAKHIWFAHNHPSGKAELSSADKAITKKLQAAFDGSGIQAHGIIATTPKDGAWVYEDPNPSTYFFDSGKYTAANQSVPTPVVERIFTESEKLGESINSPEAAKRILPSVTKGEAGLVLMDNQHQPVAFLSIKPDEAIPLKGNGQMDKLYRALSVSNSTASMLYDPKSEFSAHQYKNLGSFLQGIDNRFLDVMRGEGTNLVSLQERGLQITNPGGNFYSKTTAKTEGFTVDQLKQALPDYLQSLLKTDSFKVITAAEAVKITRDPAAQSSSGFYDPATGTTYFVADNIDDTTDLDALALHEIGVHATKLGKNDAEFQAILKQVESLLAAGNTELLAAKRQVPKGTPKDQELEEVLAYAIQSHPTLQISQRFIAWMRNAIRKLGKLLPVMERLIFVRWSNALTPEDMVYMAQAALRSAPSALMFDDGRNGSIQYSGTETESERQYREIEQRYFNADGSEKPGAMLGLNGKRTKLNKNQWIQVRTTNFKRWFGNWEASDDDKVLIVDAGKIPENVDYKNTNSVRDWLLNSNDLKTPVENEDSGTLITFTAKNLKASLKRRGGEHTQGYTVLNHLIKSAKFVGFEASNRPSLFGQDIYYGAMSANGKIYSVRIKADVRHDKTTAYKDHKPVEIENISDIEITPAVYAEGDKALGYLSKNSPPRSSAVIRLGQLVENVNASKVVDENGEPLVVYHGSPVGGFNVFDRDLAKADAKNNSRKAADDGLGFWFTPSLKIAEQHRDKDKGWGPSWLIPEGEVFSVYLKMDNPYSPVNEKRITDALGIDKDKNDGVIYSDLQEYVVFNSNQIKSATGNNGDFSPSNPNILYSKIPPIKNVAKQGNAWLKSFLNDTTIYNLQDRFIDLKRQIEKAVSEGGEIDEDSNPYLKEELYHQRTASRIKDFYDKEVNPLLETLHEKGVKLGEFQKLLHARHAPSRNAVMSMRNPNQAIIDVKLLEAEEALAEVRDNPAATRKELSEALAEYNKWRRAKPFNGTEEARLSLSGMTNTEARAIISSADPELIKLADKIDAINNKTLDLLVQYGMETPETVKALKKQWRHYVPLHRDEAHPDENNFGHPIGRGFSVRGSGMQSATGSNAEVTNILAHIMAAREQMLKRGEKNRVSNALAEFVKLNPDNDFATVDTVEVDKVLGDDGLVRPQAEPIFKRNMADNVVMFRVEGKDHAIVFNDNKPETVRLAMSLKNLDGANLDAVESLLAKGTRWFSRVNTQYNVVFGIVNLMRDTQAMALNLTNTPLHGKQGEILMPKVLGGKHFYLADAFKAILQTERQSRNADPRLKAMYDRFNKAGGTTGYAQMFEDIKSRNQSIEKEFAKLGAGKAMKKAIAMGKLLTDFNTLMENSTRLAVFMSAVNNGLSDAQAASLAKNITVNFNRKGAQATKIGAFYAFFNASAQGTAKLVETLSGPKGREIMTGAVLLGAATTAVGLMMMGDDDWEKIPEFVRERSLILPTGSDTYISIPMPLGFHLFPNIGRKLVESAFGSNRVSLTQRFLQLSGSTVSAFNPLGGSDVSEFVMPTVLDPALALWRNKDWTGHSIYKEDFNSLKPTPGFTRTKDSATWFGKSVAEVANKATGGTDYKQGLWSPTPDQLDYVIGQISGGTGREMLKVLQTIEGALSDEEVPLYKTPLVGRLAGKTSGNAAERNAYYENLRRLNEHEAEVKGLRKEGKLTELKAYIAENPEASLIESAGKIERAINKLNDKRKDLRRQGESTASIDMLIGAQMKRFNDQIASLQ